VIHIAPCSCELHVRIRELEAEVTRLTTIGTIEATKAEWLEMRARAEKAERGMKAWIEKATLAEARVAELEGYLKKGAGLTFEEYKARESKGED
jgi:hypothetical protein